MGIYELPLKPRKEDALKSYVWRGSGDLEHGEPR